MTINPEEMNIYPRLDEKDVFVTRAYATTLRPLLAVKWIACTKTHEGLYALHQITASPIGSVEITSAPLRTTPSLMEALKIAATFEESAYILAPHAVGKATEQLGLLHYRAYGAKYHFTFGEDGMPQCNAKNIFRSLYKIFYVVDEYMTCHKSGDDYILEKVTVKNKNSRQTEEYFRSSDLLQVIKEIHNFSIKTGNTAKIGEKGVVTYDDYAAIHGIQIGQRGHAYKADKTQTPIEWIREELKYKEKRQALTRIFCQTVGTSSLQQRKYEWMTLTHIKGQTFRTQTFSYDGLCQETARNDQLSFMDAFNAMKEFEEKRSTQKMDWIPDEDAPDLGDLYFSKIDTKLRILNNLADKIRCHLNLL